LFIGNDASLAYLYNYEATPIVFATSATERMRIDSSGNVGIGTDSPATTLHVENDASTSEIIRIGSSTVTHDTGLYMRTTGTAGISWGTGGALAFYGSGAGSAERMRIDASGNVGIGTSSPFFTAAGRSSLSVNGTSSSILAFGKGGSSENYILADAGGFTIANTNATLPTTFFNNGATRMTLDASGNVGINTTPKAWTAFTPVLQIKNASTGGGGALAGTSADNFRMFANTYYDGVYKRLATGFATQYAQESGTHVWSYAASGATDSTFTWSEAMRIDASGRVGIGMTPPSDRNLAVYDSTNSIFSLHNSTTGTAATDGFQLQLVSDDAYLVNYEAGGVVAFYTAPSGGSTTERMRITSGGNLLLNETGLSGNAEKFRITSGGTSSATGAALFNDSAGTELFFVRSDGAFRTGSGAASPYNNTAAVTANCFINTDGTLVRATSSRRYKKDIVDARFGLSDLLNLRPVNYKGINSEVDGDIVYGGLIAEEVHDAGLTEFVEYNKENQPDALRYQHMVSLCIKAIQEQQATIEALTARIAALES